MPNSQSKKKKSIVLEDKVEEISKNRECVKKPSKLQIQSISLERVARGRMRENIKWAMEYSITK